MLALFLETIHAGDKYANKPKYSCNEKDGCQYKSCGPPVIDFVLHQGSNSGKKIKNTKTYMQV
jgi:hypothetical protein